MWYDTYRISSQDGNKSMCENCTKMALLLTETTDTKTVNMATQPG
ncbi:hypothetical protein X975_00762, partial [Stegodyphus mimosarum]